MNNDVKDEEEMINHNLQLLLLLIAFEEGEEDYSFVDNQLIRVNEFLFQMYLILVNLNK